MGNKARKKEKSRVKGMSQMPKTRMSVEEGRGNVNQTVRTERSAGPRLGRISTQLRRSDHLLDYFADG